MRHLIFSGLISLSLFAVGCGANTDCGDCGPCGISSPTSSPGHDVNVLDSGVTDGGVAAVDLALEEGMCIGTDRKRFRLSYEADAVTLAPGEGLAKLDATNVTFQDDVSTWSDRSLTMAVSRSGETLLLSFSSGGKILKVACNGANHTITCAKM
jgi:hypothetical protein